MLLRLTLKFYKCGVICEIQIICKLNDIYCYRDLIHNLRVCQKNITVSLKFGLAYPTGKDSKSMSRICTFYRFVLNNNYLSTPKEVPWSFCKGADSVWPLRQVRELEFTDPTCGTSGSFQPLTRRALWTRAGPLAGLAGRPAPSSAGTRGAGLSHPAACWLLRVSYCSSLLFAGSRSLRRATVVLVAVWATNGKDLNRIRCGRPPVQLSKHCN